MQLKSIKYPSDLKQCSLKQLNSISKELRKYIIDVISSNEGHLGASLGVVELTILLHYVFFIKYFFKFIVRMSYEVRMIRVFVYK